MSSYNSFSRIRDGIRDWGLAMLSRLGLPDIGSQLIQYIAAFLRDVIAIVAREQGSASRVSEQAIDGGKFAQ